MSSSIIVSMLGPNQTIMIEMFKQDEAFFVRTYETMDHAIARFEKLYERFHGNQPSSRMGTAYKLDPRIHEVEGNDVTFLIQDDIVVREEFRVFPFRTDYGMMVGAYASGAEAEKWHTSGLVPGGVKI